MRTKTISRAEVNKNFGYWVRIQLHKIERPADWLHHRLGIAGGSVNRWSNGSQPALDTFRRVIKLLAVQLQMKTIDLVNDYFNYCE